MFLQKLSHKLLVSMTLSRVELDVARRELTSPRLIAYHNWLNIFSSSDEKFEGLKTCLNEKFSLEIDKVFLFGNFIKIHKVYARMSIIVPRRLFICPGELTRFTRDWFKAFGSLEQSTLNLVCKLIILLTQLDAQIESSFFIRDLQTINQQRELFCFSCFKNVEFQRTQGKRARNVEQREEICWARA